MTYYLFEFLGTTQIARTKRMTATMIRTLKSNDYKELVAKALEVSTRVMELPDDDNDQWNFTQNL